MTHTDDLEDLTLRGDPLKPENLEKFGKKWKKRVAEIKEEEAKKPKKPADPKFAPVIGRVSGGTAPHAVVRCIDDVEAKPITWLWPGRIACGKLTLLAGDPGLGKSQITAALAGIVTQGGLWPVDGTRCPSGSVIFLSAEDDAADTIRPRLEAVGANLRRCFILDAIQETDETGAARTRYFSLKGDLARLASVMRDIGDVRLIVIDPITAYMGGIDSHKNTDVRAMLTPIAEIAEACGVAVLGVSHLNKSNAQEALQRVSGSLAFVAAARAALIVVKDKASPARRLLLPLKNNLGKDTGGLAFAVQSATLDNGIETSRIEWERDAVNMTADDALNFDADQDKSGERAEARRFLLELLADGPVLATEAERQYQEAGLSPRTINRAKKDLGVVSEKRGKAGWTWEIPKIANVAKDDPCEKVGNLGNLPAGRGFQPENNAVFGEGCQANELAIFKKTGLKTPLANRRSPRPEDDDETTETTHALTI
jgi:energy-coupling factor transporter ATP-binding protein EcfA2